MVSSTRGMTAILMLALLAGCAAKPAAEPVDVGSLVASLESNFDAVRSFAEGGEVDGHQALHDVGHCLTQLSKLKAAGDLTPEACKKIADAAKKMMGAYGEIDDAIHKSEPFEYGKYESDLTESLAIIKAASNP